MAFLCLKDEKLRSILLSPSNLKAGCLVAIFEKRGREKENASIVVSSIMAKLEMANIIHLQMGINVNLPFYKDFFAIRISRLSTNQQCLCHRFEKKLRDKHCQREFKIAKVFSYQMKVFTLQVDIFCHLKFCHNRRKCFLLLDAS